MSVARSIVRSNSLGISEGSSPPSSTPSSTPSSPSSTPSSPSSTPSSPSSTPSDSSAPVFYTCYLNSSGNYNCVKGDAFIPGKISRGVSVPSFVPSFAHKAFLWDSLSSSFNIIR
jgi:hypothetical protein